VNSACRAVGARYFVSSTNNACFKHPNGAAVARVIVGSNEPALWLNRETSPSRQWQCPN
jgi:hypothetical protein